MRFFQFGLAAGLLSIIAGCATQSYPLPKCDGYAKRPLNRSMWDWDGAKIAFTQPKPKSPNKTVPASPFAPAPFSMSGVDPFAVFDEVSSYRSCRVG